MSIDTRDDAANDTRDSGQDTFIKTPIWDAEFAERWAALQAPVQRAQTDPHRPVKRKPRRPSPTK